MPHPLSLIIETLAVDMHRPLGATTPPRQILTPTQILEAAAPLQIVDIANFPELSKFYLNLFMHQMGCSSFWDF